MITAYSIIFGGFLLLGGRLSDLLGRRRLFVAGLTLFTVGSLLDGLAWSEASLITFRRSRASERRLLSPAALSILTTTFREGRERNLALGIWGAAPAAAAPPACSSAVRSISGLSWSWIFYINVPVGWPCSALTPFLLRESNADLATRHFDLAGATSITGGLMLLVYAMTRAAQHGWGTDRDDRPARRRRGAHRDLLRDRGAIPVRRSCRCGSSACAPSGVERRAGS